MEVYISNLNRFECVPLPKFMYYATYNVAASMPISNYNLLVCYNLLAKTWLVITLPDMYKQEKYHCHLYQYKIR